MKKQKLVLKKINSFELEHIFDCGQCFRWNKQEDNSYIGVIKNGVMKVYEDKNNIVFEGILEGDIKSIVYDYFDFSTDYEKYKIKLAKIDENMKSSIMFGHGIRILNQDLWEMIISFIISANNNIPRIKGIIERISRKSWKENYMEWNRLLFISYNRGNEQA